MENEITAHRAGKVTELAVVRGRLGQRRRPDRARSNDRRGVAWRRRLRGAARASRQACRFRRQGAAAPQRRLAQALALRGRLLRRAPASAPRGSRSARRARPSGRSATASAARCASARGCGCPAPAARSGPRPRGEEAAPAASTGRRRPTGLAGPDRGDRDGGREQVRAFLRVGEGELGRVDLPDGRGATATCGRASARRPGRSATSASASALDASRRAGSRTSRPAITRGTRSGAGRPGVGETTRRPLGRLEPGRGINDPPQRSERAIWVDGEPVEPGPVTFDGLDAIDFDDGARLEFAAECERRKAEKRALVKLRVPPAVRHLHRHPPRRDRARPRPRRRWSTTTPTGEAGSAAPQG